MRQGELKEGQSRSETLETESGPSWKASPAPGYGAVSVYGGVISYADEWEEWASFWGKGGDFQELGQHPLFDLYGQPWNCHRASVCVT